MIQPSTTLPNQSILSLNTQGKQEVIQTLDQIKDQKVLMFGIPGAYTPVCSNEHLPHYLKNLETLQKQGVDRIICLLVNDPFVAQAWAKEHGALGKIEFWLDWDGQLTKAMGLDIDLSQGGLGIRTKRFASIIDKGVIQTLNVENSPSQFDTCRIENIMA